MTKSINCDDKRFLYNSKDFNFKHVLLKYIKFIQSPSRQESLLKSAQYSLWLLSKFYNVSTTVTTLAGNNAGKSVSCTDGKEEEQQQMSRIPKALLELKTEISWARYLLRFFALPAAMNAIDNRIIQMIIDYWQAHHVLGGVGGEHGSARVAPARHCPTSQDLPGLARSCTASQGRAQPRKVVPGEPGCTPSRQDLPNGKRRKGRCETNAPR